MIIYHCCCYVLSQGFFCLLWGDGGLGMGEGVKFIYYLLPPWQNQVMFLVALVCLSVCLFVENITQKVMNGMG